MELASICTFIFVSGIIIHNHLYSHLTCYCRYFPVASRLCQGSSGKLHFPGPAASWGTGRGPCGEKAWGSGEYQVLQTLHLPVGSYLWWRYQDRSMRLSVQRDPTEPNHWTRRRNVGIFILKYNTQTCHIGTNILTDSDRKCSTEQI